MQISNYSNSGYKNKFAVKMVEEKYTYSLGLKHLALIVLLSFTSAVLTYAQADKKFIRKGNHEYEKEKFLVEKYTGRPILVHHFLLAGRVKI